MIREQFQVQVTDAVKTRRRATQSPGYIMGVEGNDAKKKLLSTSLENQIITELILKEIRRATEIF